MFMVFVKTRVLSITVLIMVLLLVTLFTVSVASRIRQGMHSGEVFMLKCLSFSLFQQCIESKDLLPMVIQLSDKLFHVELIPYSKACKGKVITDRIFRI